MEKISLFTIGGTLSSILMILFFVALMFDNPNEPTDPSQDWVGITFTVVFFISTILTVVGAISEQNKNKVA
jgi:uncharacterized membrane protein